MNIEILSDAEDDILRGYDFYENQSQGLGEYFVNSIFSDIEFLQISAGIHSLHFEKYYRLLSKRFPFAIYYTIDQETVFIHAAIDCRSNPAVIRERLQHENP